MPTSARIWSRPRRCSSGSSGRGFGPSWNFSTTRRSCSNSSWKRTRGCVSPWWSCARRAGRGRCGGWPGRNRGPVWAGKGKPNRRRTSCCAGRAGGQLVRPGSVDPATGSQSQPTAWSAPPLERRPGGADQTGTPTPSPYFDMVGATQRASLQRAAHHRSGRDDVYGGRGRGDRGGFSRWRVSVGVAGVTHGYAAPGTGADGWLTGGAWPTTKTREPRTWASMESALALSSSASTRVLGPPGRLPGCPHPRAQRVLITNPPRPR